MFKGPSEAGAFAASLVRETRGLADREVAVFPPFTALPTVAQALRGSGIEWGGQNMHWENSGAFTGEIAPGFLTELGCRYVLVGHSERRALFGETDEICNRKLRSALAAKLTPVLCVGELLVDRDAGRTFEVVTTQLAGGLAGVDTEAEFAVAYEPVWAIGTGRTATSGQAGEVHTRIRQWLDANISPDTAFRTRILYGGSVKPDNVDALMRVPDVDGALVGGASLDVAQFARIIRFAP